MPTPSFDADLYWKSGIVGKDAGDLDEVGHPDMGRSFNREAYSLRLRALQRGLDTARCSRPSSVFEGAFGVGFYQDWWHAIGVPRVAGVDLSANAAENAHARWPNHQLRQGDLATMDRWPDWTALRRSFEVVTAIDVVYHILDDDDAGRAVEHLGALVQPGGVLVLTEKFPQERHQRERHVVRRPRHWYEAHAAAAGLHLERTMPVFWCMDPALPARGVSAAAARALWIGFRAATKFWPPRSRVQELCGGAAGALGRQIDSVVVPRLSKTSNMELAIFRAPGEEVRAAAASR